MFSRNSFFVLQGRGWVKNVRWDFSKFGKINFVEPLEVEEAPFLPKKYILTNFEKLQHTFFTQPLPVE
jgi:hypothetical protein